MRATIFSILRGSSPSRMRGAITSQIMLVIDPCISPRYQEEVSPESEKPTRPSSVVILRTTLSIRSMRVLGMMTGFFIGVEMGMHSICSIFMAAVLRVLIPVGSVVLARASQAGPRRRFEGKGLAAKSQPTSRLTFLAEGDMPLKNGRRRRPVCDDC